MSELEKLLQSKTKKKPVSTWKRVLKMVLKALAKNPTTKRTFLISGGIAGIILVVSLLFTLAISHIVIVDFLLAIAPKSFLNGINILALGLDDTKDIQRSDTIMVLHMDFDHNRVGILSIPRDTRVNIPGVGFTKVNHAFARGGEELARETISQLLGIPIEYYVTLRLQGLQKVVDQLGGVMIDIKKDMYYVDKSGDLYINLKKGPQELDGKGAMEYLRFRHDEDADIGRIGRQQGFIQAVSDKILHSSQFLEIPSLMHTLSKDFETNLSITQMIGLASQFRSAYRAGKVVSGTVPGVPILIEGISYWKADVAGLDAVVQKDLIGVEAKDEKMVSTVDTLDKEASQEIRRTVTLKEVNRNLTHAGTTVDSLQTLSKQIEMEILNGIGRPGEAKKAVKLLKNPKIKVLHTANAATFKYDDTLIVVWKGNAHVNDALILARFMSIDPSKIIVYDKPQKPLDITLVLGQDWDAIKLPLEHHQDRR